MHFRDILRIQYTGDCYWVSAMIFQLSVFYRELLLVDPPWILTCSCYQGLLLVDRRWDFAFSVYHQGLLLVLVIGGIHFERHLLFLQSFQTLNDVSTQFVRATHKIIIFKHRLQTFAGYKKSYLKARL